MSPALILILALVIPGHRDWTLIPKQCESCHVGHGVSATKLLPKEEPEYCLMCHGGPAATSEMVQMGYLSIHARPSDISHVRIMIHKHPETEGCSICHAGHGLNMTEYNPESMPKFSTKRMNEYEYELCLSCHVNMTFQDHARSSHPVKNLESSGDVPSLKDGLDQPAWIACSDCHGADSNNLPPGVHASNVPNILKYNFQDHDGFEEEADSYAACYVCHERESILGDESFPYHRLHVQDELTSCFTCHDSHASLTLPWLLAIEDNTRKDRIGPDHSGRRTYVQTGPGAGTCYLTCHGAEHNGWSYGPDSDQKNVEQRQKQLLRDPSRRMKSSLLDTGKKTRP